MRQLTIGKLRGSQQISSRRGTITALALDHCQNLRKANPTFQADEELSRFKVEVTHLLAKRATACCSTRRSLQFSPLRSERLISPVVGRAGRKKTRS